MADAPVVAPSEVALLVHHYLQREFPRSGAAFQAEAAALLADVQPPDGDVKRLEQILGEYVSLESDARKRTDFELTFGEGVAVRSIVARIGRLLDDYQAICRRPSAIANSQPPQHHTCPAPTHATGDASQQIVVGAVASVPPSGRSRKSRPRRRDMSASGDIAVVSSRKLFGKGANGNDAERTLGDGASNSSASDPPWLSPGPRHLGAGGWQVGTEDHENDDGSTLGSHMPEILPVLGDRIAQHINTLPDRAAGATHGSNGMSVDEIVQALLTDPQASGALNALATQRPSTLPTQSPRSAQKRRLSP